MGTTITIGGALAFVVGLLAFIIRNSIDAKINNFFNKNLEKYKTEFQKELEKQRNDFQKELEQQKSILRLIEVKNSSKWEIKRAACLYALDVADAIISQRSWSDIPGNGRARSKVSTIEARKAYNQLACSCESLKTLEIFRKIMSSTGNDISVDIIVDFRNAIRNELEFKGDIDDERISAFIFKGPWYDSL